MIAIRPPEYWPRPNFFALMDAADLFVLADTFQYSRQSFQNRTRLRTPDGWQWISVPLKGGQHGRPVNRVEIRRKQPWRGKHWRALQFNYRTTPFFEFYEHRLGPLFDADWSILSELTVASVRTVGDILGIVTPVVLASELDGAPSSLKAVLRRCGDEELIVPSETREIDAPFASAVQAFYMSGYRQNFDGFEAGMSALDLLLNYGPAALGMIRNHARALDEPTS